MGSCALLCLFLFHTKTILWVTPLSSYVADPITASYPRARPEKSPVPASAAGTLFDVVDGYLCASVSYRTHFVACALRVCRSALEHLAAPHTNAKKGGGGGGGGGAKAWVNCKKMVKRITHRVQ